MTINTPSSTRSSATKCRSSKPAWDDTVHDLTKLRLTPQEQNLKKANRLRYEAPLSDEMQKHQHEWTVCGKLQELLEKHHITVSPTSRQQQDENAHHQNIVDLDQELGRFQGTPGEKPRAPLQPITPSPLAHKHQESRSNMNNDLHGIHVVVQKYQMLVKPDSIPDQPPSRTVSLDWILRQLTQTLIDAELQRGLQTEDYKAKLIRCEQQIHRLQRKLSEQQKSMESLMNADKEKNDQIKEMQISLEAQRGYIEDLEARIQLVYREKSHQHIIRTLQTALSGQVADNTFVNEENEDCETTPDDRKAVDEAKPAPRTIREESNSNSITANRKRTVRFEPNINSGTQNDDKSLFWVPLDSLDDADKAQLNEAADKITRIGDDDDDQIQFKGDLAEGVKSDSTPSITSNRQR